jgi:hypothetical protein
MTLTESKFQASKWLERIRNAEKPRDEWSKKFKCERLNEYYEGNQWATISDYEPYFINLFFSTIGIKKPALLFKRPRFKVNSKPQVENFDFELSTKLNQFRQDTLNTLIAQNNIKFAENAEMAILDAFFYFGIVEVGYSADWTMNPAAEHPELAEDYKENVIIGQGETIGEVPPLPENERIYIKRIPADKFVVNKGANWDIGQCNWCGYSEWMRASDVTSKDSGFKFTDEITITPGVNEGSEYDEDEKDMTQNGDMVKVWKIWDLRQKTLNIISTVGNTIIYQEDYKRLPLFSLRFVKRRRGWYPIPLSFNWKMPQDEYNESREQMRTMRRRTKRLWQCMENAIDEEEKVKAKSGPDGTIITVKRDNALQPVVNPPIDNVTEKSLVISKDDFNIVSATTSEARGESDQTTATQANITNARAGIREGHEREVVAEWLCDIGREVLLQCREKLTSKVWIELNTAMGAFGQDYADIQNKWQLIDPMKDLGTEGNDEIFVELEVESLSPIVNEQSKATFMEFLAILNKYPQLSFNPILIREAAYRIGYRNEGVIKAFQEMAQLQMIGMVEQGKQAVAQLQGQNTNIDQKTVEQMEPNTQAQIETQMQNQGVPQ